MQLDIRVCENILVVVQWISEENSRERELDWDQPLWYCIVFFRSFFYYFFIFYFLQSNIFLSWLCLDESILRTESNQGEKAPIVEALYQLWSGDDSIWMHPKCSTTTLFINYLILYFLVSLTHFFTFLKFIPFLIHVNLKGTQNWIFYLWFYHTHTHTHMHVCMYVYKLHIYKCMCLYV